MSDEQKPPLDPKALRADVDGWRGTFELVRDHRCHYCDQDGGVDGSILYRPEEDTHEGCEALVHISDVEHAYPGCAEPLVRMLNAVGPLVVEVERLLERQQEHLKLIAKLTQTAPFQSEIDGWASQRAAMTAEIGTLRARIAELEREIQSRDDAAWDRSR